MWPQMATMHMLRCTSPSLRMLVRTRRFSSRSFWKTRVIAFQGNKICLKNLSEIYELLNPLEIQIIIRSSKRTVSRRAVDRYAAHVRNQQSVQARITRLRLLPHLLLAWNWRRLFDWVASYYVLRFRQQILIWITLHKRRCHTVRFAVRIGNSQSWQLHLYHSCFAQMYLSNKRLTHTKSNYFLISIYLDKPVDFRANIWYIK